MVLPRKDSPHIRREARQIGDGKLVFERRAEAHLREGGREGEREGGIGEEISDSKFVLEKRAEAHLWEGRR